MNLPLVEEKISDKTSASAGIEFNFKPYAEISHRDISQKTSTQNAPDFFSREQGLVSSFSVAASHGALARLGYSYSRYEQGQGEGPTRYSIEAGLQKGTKPPRTGVYIEGTYDRTTFVEGGRVRVEAGGEAKFGHRIDAYGRARLTYQGDKSPTTGLSQYFMAQAERGTNQPLEAKLAAGVCGQPSSSIPLDVCGGVQVRETGRLGAHLSVGRPF